MNYHIVRMNETISKIALTYNLSLDEIKDINKHIRNWDNLTPGMRLNLPAVPDILKDNLNDIEPFIEDYYPKYNENINVVEVDNKNINDNKISENTKSVESKNISTPNKNINQIKYPYIPFYYNGYYPPYQMYYRNYYSHIKKKINRS